MKVTIEQIIALKYADIISLSEAKDLLKTIIAYEQKWDSLQKAMNADAETRKKLGCCMVCGK